MKHAFALRIVALAASIAPVLAVAATAQRVIVQNGPADGFVLRELGAVMVPDPAGDAALVERVVEAERRPAAYRNLDIVNGDRVIAVNGKRVRSAKEAEAAYVAIAIGQQVELGIERAADGGPQRFIVRFAKADPATLPQPQMRMVRIEGDPNADVDPMPALGAVMSQKHAKGSPVEVVAVLPNGDAIFKQGDHVVSLDGQPVRSLADFGKRWDAIAVGAKVTLVLENGGKRRTQTFERREAPAGERVIAH